jgi:S-DNA-T family DNA segregation ATPase FtsK/SpoIIIE
MNIHPIFCQKLLHCAAGAHLLLFRPIIYKNTLNTVGIGMSRALVAIETGALARRDEIHGFSKRRLGELLGLGLMGLAGAIFLSLLSYDPKDPSFNVTTDRAAENWMSGFGSHMADFLLQTVGLASIVLVAVCVAWGWRLFSACRVRFLSLRLIALVSALLGGSVFFAMFETPMSWPLASGLGGAVGHLVKYNLSSVFPAFLLGLVGLLAFIAGGVMAMGLRRDEWQRIGAGLLALVRGGVAIGAWVRRQRDSRLNFDDYPDHLQETTGLRGFFARMKERFSRDAWEEEEYRPRRRNPRMRHPIEEDEEEYEVEDLGAEEEEEYEEYEEEEAPAPRPRKVAARKPAQTSLNLREGPYEMPDVDLLNPPPKKAKRTRQDENALAQNAKMLEGVLQEFGVQGKIIEFKPGPVVTLYQLEPAPGTRSQRVINLSGDIARSMSAVSARISVVPGSNALGIELPNSNRETVYFREMLESDGFVNAEAKLPLALGKNIGGEPVIVDLARMPHLLVAGTTGSGKSVAINTMITSLLYKHTPETCKFIMIDPKMLELSVYEGIPHLLSPVVTEPGKAIVALKWTVKEMENRYRLMSTLGVRNVEGYNKRIAEAKRKGEELTRTVQTGFDADTGKPIYEEQPLEMVPLPFIVVVVDEMADLMATAGKEIEVLVQRLAQMARAAGIHIILATQRPSVDVITGVIKANFPTRISFQVTSRHDSRTILNEDGAEQLLGQGDMLYMAGGSRTTRVHGPFVSDAEVEAIVTHLKAQGEPNYVEEVTRDEEEDAMLFGADGDGDDEEAGLYRQAVAIVKRDKKASTSYIQRQLRIGYNRAARLVEQMEHEGIVSPASATGKRDVLVD